MYDSLRATRGGLHLALAYTVPLAVWLLGQGWLTVSGQGIPGPAMHQLLSCLLLLQACALTLCTPWLLRYRTPAQHFCSLAMLLLAPLPLYSIAWAAGAVEAQSLFMVWIYLGVLALCLYWFFRLCTTLIPVGQARSLSVLCSQLLLLLLCWVFRADWLGWLGL